MRGLATSDTTPEEKTDVRNLSGATFCGVRGIEREYCTMVFSGGVTLTGKMPYSKYPTYLYDISYRKGDGASGVILSLTPKRPACNAKTIYDLIERTKIDVNIAEMMENGDMWCDMGTSDEDYSGVMKSQYRDIYDQLLGHQEGIYYFLFEEIALLRQFYGDDVLKRLSAEHVSKLYHQARTEPVSLAFRIKIEFENIPELDFDNVQKLAFLNDMTLSFKQKSAISLYKNWLLPDLNGKTKNGFSVVSRNRQLTEEYKEGIQWLCENKIVIMETKSTIIMMQIMQWEASISDSLKELRRRVQKMDDFDLAIASRHEPSDPYHLRSTLKPLTDDQREALDIIEGSGIINLCGRAGTGKTTILAQMVAKYASGTILCCAPTNRAADVLSSKVIPSFTMHSVATRLLRRERQESDDIEREQVRCLVIDEASMIGMRIFSVLLEICLKSLPNLTTVILCGDPNQLESIELGNVLNDSIAMHPTATLKVCHRVSKESIIIFENANTILERSTRMVQEPGIFSFFNPSGNAFEDIKKLIGDDGSLLEKKKIHFITFKRDARHMISSAIKAVTRGRNDQECILQGIFEKGDKLVCRISCHAQRVFRGEFYRLEAIFQVVDEITHELDFLPAELGVGEFYFNVSKYSFDTGSNVQSHQRTIRLGFEKDMMSPKHFALGYCTTNHSFQGCEADVIVYHVVPPIYQSMSYHDAYTAVMRARKEVVIWSEKLIFEELITKRHIPRKTYLVDHIERRVLGDIERRSEGQLKNEAMFSAEKEGDDDQTSKRPR